MRWASLILCQRWGREGRAATPPPRTAKEGRCSAAVVRGGQEGEGNVPVGPCAAGMAKGRR